MLVTICHLIKSQKVDVTIEIQQSASLKYVFCTFTPIIIVRFKSFLASSLRVGESVTEHST